MIYLLKFDGHIWIQNFLNSICVALACPRVFKLRHDGKNEISFFISCPSFFVLISNFVVFSGLFWKGHVLRIRAPPRRVLARAHIFNGKRNRCMM